jgi:hypothetical protein
MLGWLARVFDLREGEGRLLARVFLLLFGMIGAHTMLETARDALFLGKLPANRLTIVYAVLAGLALLVSALTQRIVDNFGRRNGLIFSLVTAAWGTLFAYFQPETPAVVLAFYVWSGLLGTVLVVQFWMLAGQLFTLAQGKRLFGLIASGGVMGAAAGASAAAAIVRAMPVKALLLIATAIFFACAFLLTFFEADESRPSSVEYAKVGPNARGVIELLKEQPYLLRIALMTLLSTAAILTVDYLFKSVAASTIPKDELGGFFAQTYAALNLVSLIVQVFIAGRIIRRFGVMVSILILPICFLAGGTGVLVLGSALYAALVLKGSDGALRHSLARVASELLWLPLPSALRDRGKALFETVLSRAVQAAMAGIILVLSSFELATPRVLAAILLGLVFAWLAVDVALRRPYLGLFRSALARGSLDGAGHTGELDLTNLESVFEALSSRDSERVLAAMQLLRDGKRTRLIPGLILYHESDDVLLAALEVVASSDREDWVPLAERLLSRPSEAVRIAALRALGRTGARGAVEAAREDNSPAVRAHAAMFLAQADGREPLKDPSIQALLALEGEERIAASTALAEAVRPSEVPSPGMFELVEALCMFETIELVVPTSSAIGRVKDPRFVAKLIPRLAIREGRGAVRDALLAIGEPALVELERAMLDVSTDLRVLLHIPRTISRFRSQRAVDFLTTHLGNEALPGSVRYKVLRGLGRIIQESKDLKPPVDAIRPHMQKNVIEHLRILAVEHALQSGGEGNGAKSGAGELLRGLLEDKRKQALERAFRLLQIMHRHEDLRRVYHALESSDRRARANALEFMETILLDTERTGGAGSSRELWRLTIDDLPPKERVTRTRRFFAQPPPENLEQALSELLRDKDESLAALAAFFALELGNAKLEQSVRMVCVERPALAQLIERQARMEVAHA